MKSEWEKNRLDLSDRALITIPTMLKKDDLRIFSLVSWFHHMKKRHQIKFFSSNVYVVL